MIASLAGWDASAAELSDRFAKGTLQSSLNPGGEGIPPDVAAVEVPFNDGSCDDAAGSGACETGEPDGIGAP